MQQNLSYASTFTSNTKVSSDSNEENVTASTRSPFYIHDWSTCLFCKCKTHKKIKETINVSTFEACESIRYSAEAKGDEGLLHIIRGVNYNLRIAAEAKYHKNCFATYVSKRNLKYSSFKEGEKESHYHQAFQELAKDLKECIDEGKAFDMGTLLDDYRKLLQKRNVSADSCIKQNLKIRLRHQFNDDVVFHQPFDKTKPEVVHSSKISLQDEINAAVSIKQSTSSSSEESIVHKQDEASLIFSAAKILKAEVRRCQGVSLNPFNVNNLSTERTKCLIPQKSPTMDHCN